MTLHRCYLVAVILGNICAEWAKPPLFTLYSLVYEEEELTDNAEYTVFECARWKYYRLVLTSTFGTIHRDYDHE